jgi:hypothetical protein
MTPVQGDQIIPMRRLEDDVVGEKDSDGLARPALKDCVSDALGFWLDRDLDRKWMLVGGEELAELELDGGQHDDGAFETCARSFSERVCYEGFAAQGQELLRNIKACRGESSAQPR